MLSAPHACAAVKAIFRFSVMGNGTDVL